MIYVTSIVLKARLREGVIAIASKDDLHTLGSEALRRNTRLDLKTDSIRARLSASTSAPAYLKVPLLIVEPKQKLIPSAPDGMIPETAYDTICTPIIFDFNRRMIIPWSVRRIGALGDNTVELLSDVPDPLLNFFSSPSVLADR